MNIVEIQGEGCVIRGVPTPEIPTGLFIGPKGLQGWQGTPSRRRDAIERPLSNGEHDAPVRLSARIITIDPGVIVADSEFDLQQLCHQMNGWGATGRAFKLTVDQLGETLTTTVRVISAEAFDSNRRVGGLHMGEFSAQLIAADPRKYGTGETYTVTSPGGSVDVESLGNFPAHPTIEIPNAPSSYSIESPAGVFAVTGVEAGGTHRVELLTGRVTRDGVLIPGAGNGPLWSIPNGETWGITLSAAGRIIMPRVYV